MIQRFTFGCPLPTESVVLPVEPAAAAVPHLTAEPDGSWSFSLAEDAVVYGLGEMPRGINKRGWHYVTDNTDESHHGENRLSYYGAHNFLLIDGGAGRSVFGVFVDFPGKVFYDIGYTRHDRLTFRTEEPDYDLYILTGDSPNAVCTEFRKLIGHSYIPPKWAFGFAQSRWGLQDCRGRARHRPPVPRERAASGHDLPGHRLYARVRGFYGEQGALPGSGCAECRAEAAGHPAGAHHRRGRAHRPGGPHLHRGAGEGVFLHQSRRHPLCGCRVARQGLFCRFSAPGSAGLVRPPLQGADRLRY